jgi:transposase
MDRQQRAAAMRAADPGGVHQISDHLWLVRSQNSGGSYKVQFENSEWSCGCEDFRDWGEPCKHICRVQLDLSPAANSVPIPRQALAPKKQYTQNWPAYDMGQTEEMRLLEVLLRDLVNEVEEIPQLPGHIGRPRTPLGDAIFCAILKVGSGRSGRRAHGVHQHVAERGLLSRVPSFMVVSRVLNRDDVTPILYRLLSLSASPLAELEEGQAIAPDSTGIQTTSFGGWREAKHGERRSKKWLKLHAMVGTKTHIIIRAVVGEENSGDSPQFAPLVQSTVEAGFHPGSVVADKGYLSYANYRLAGDLGMEVYIPFKSSSMSRRKTHGSPSAWRKAYHLFHADREGFDRNYHRRSNVESAFSALKRKFGENVRSRNPIAQVNEILCKLIAYNLTVVIHEIFEHGIAPAFMKHKPAE